MSYGIGSRTRAKLVVEYAEEALTITVVRKKGEDVTAVLDLTKLTTQTIHTLIFLGLKQMFYKTLSNRQGAALNAAILRFVEKVNTGDLQLNEDGTIAKMPKTVLAYAKIKGMELKEAWMRWKGLSGDDKAREAGRKSFKKAMKEVQKEG